MSNSKTGGNKKVASPSDIRYQAVRKLTNRDEVNRKKRVNRHRVRMARKQAHLAVRAAAGKP